MDGMNEEVSVRELGQPGDLGWVVQAHGELYSREFGWDVDFERLVARIVGEFATDAEMIRQAAWVAEVDGHRAGCIFCMAGDDPQCARLRLLLVDPRFRGLGLGSTLVERCVEFARDAGYERIGLWTNDVLTSARTIYEAAGFVLVEEGQHHSFGQDLVGQNWERQLTRLQ
jgi:GNAT superfamily N-acetyltransferase